MARSCLARMSRKAPPGKAAPKTELFLDVPAASSSKRAQSTAAAQRCSSAVLGGGGPNKGGGGLALSTNRSNAPPLRFFVARWSSSSATTRAVSFEYSIFRTGALSNRSRGLCNISPFCNLTLACSTRSRSNLCGNQIYFYYFYGTIRYHTVPYFWPYAKKEKLEDQAIDATSGSMA